MAWQDFKPRAAHDVAEERRGQDAIPAPVKQRPPALRAVPSGRTARSPRPIPADDIAMLFEAAVTAAMLRGMTREDARPVALEILRSTLANDPRLPQPGSAGSCVICNQGEGHAPLVPVMTARPSVHVWLHVGACHAGYRASRAALVDEEIRATGIKV